MQITDGSLILIHVCVCETNNNYIFVSWFSVSLTYFLTTFELIVYFVVIINGKKAECRVSSQNMYALWLLLTDPLKEVLL